MMTDDNNESSERMPYLELGKELPPESTEEQSKDHNLPIPQPELHEGNEPYQSNQYETQSFWNQLRSTPIHRLLVVTFSVLVIILLLPRFLIALSPFVIQVMLIIRVLLPLFVAIGIAWFIMQWLRQNSR